MAKKSSVNINDFSTWTFPVIVLVGCLIATAFVFLIKKFLVDDVSTKIKSKNSLIEKQEKQYDADIKIVALLPHIRKEVADLEVIRDEAKQYLPTDISMPSLIDNVYLAARESDIVFNSFSPEKDIETEFYTIKPISLSAKVGYVSMSSFIEKVTTLKRIMNVNSVSFSAEKKSIKKGEKLTSFPDKPLTMTAQLRTYIFKDNQKSATKK